MRLDEISSKALANYKKAASADASKADKEGKYKRGDKRFRGIVKATKKEFEKDTKRMKNMNEDIKLKEPTEEELHWAYLNLKNGLFAESRMLKQKFLELQRQGRLYEDS